MLLFNVEGRDFYLLMCEKTGQLEQSIVAVKKEVKEELSFENIDYFRTAMEKLMGRDISLEIDNYLVV